MSDSLLENSSPNRSPGPRTQSGKATSSQNAIKHGCCSQKTILRDEDPAEFEFVVQGWFDHYRPDNQLTRALVEDLARAHWFLKRASKRLEEIEYELPGWFGSDQPYEIVGLVGDVKAFELRQPPYPTVYFNMFQENQLMDQFELRTAVNPAALSGTVRRIVRDLLKTVPVTRVTTLAEQVDSNIVPERLIATLSQFFGVLGAALAGIGLYGLLAYTVARRTNEVGIRMALGATASDVSSLILRDALGMVCGGLIAGALLVFLSRSLVLSLVPDLKLDSAGPLIFGGWTIIAVALLASYVPVRRAVRVGPMVALRHD